MPRRKPNYDFQIHVDPSCLSDTMDDEIAQQNTEIEKMEEESSATVEAPSTTTVDDQLLDEDPVDSSIVSEGQDAEDNLVEPEPEADDTTHDTSSIHEDNDDVEPELQLNHHNSAVQQLEDDSESVLPSIEHDDDEEEEPETRTSTRNSSRRTSKRTEELIQAAARDIVAQIGNHNEAKGDDDGDDSMLSIDTSGSHGPDQQEPVEADLSHTGNSELDPDEEAHREDHEDYEEEQEQADDEIELTDTSHAENAESDKEDKDEPELELEEEQLDETDNSRSEAFVDESHEATTTVEETGDSSSQHEATDEDVFGDKSPRSSLGGSYDGESESGKATDIPDSATISTRTPRVSNISQYDRDDDFIPTTRGTPRPPFRTPSDVRAMQMSSPPPSAYGSVLGSPRSSKRPFPSVSRLGSPAPSAQYSPKNRTPSRFKVNKEPPLVLLHATLLPLRWMWANLMDDLDPSEMSEEAKTLRESWRMLQDRMGDDVLERGILLGHPQGDYEILEERLLESLDLPMRRRARILECGHYLGPANENTIGDDSESEDDYEADRPPVRRHWCTKCKNEIRYDSLGPGKIFRVKVYASNGLMNAGSWAACWKEMERVDIKLEPVVEASVQEELARAAAIQREREAAQQQQLDLVASVTELLEEQQSMAAIEQSDLMHAQVQVPSLPREPSPYRSADAERQRHDEDRLREIYGQTPGLLTEHSHFDTPSHQPQSQTYGSQSPERSQSQESCESRRSHRPSHQSDSLAELLLQSLRVLMQDRRNVLIVTLGVFVLSLALRSAPQQLHLDSAAFELKSAPSLQHIPIPEAPPVVVQDPVPVVETIVSYYTITETASPSHPLVVYETVEPMSTDIAWETVQPMSTYAALDPCVTPAVIQPQQQEQHQNQQQLVRAIEPGPEPEPSIIEAPQTVTQRTTVRRVETITETETVKIETVTEIETTKVRVTATITETAQIYVEATSKPVDSSVSPIKKTPLQAPMRSPARVPVMEIGAGVEVEVRPGDIDIV